MNDGGGYSTSTTLLDAPLRTRQTQDRAVTTATGRIVSNTFHDSHGWAYKADSDYYDNQSNANSTLVRIADNKADQQTLTSYDGLGRATVVTSLDDRDPHRRPGPDDGTRPVLHLPDGGHPPVDREGVPGPLTRRLSGLLAAVHRGEAPDPHHWCHVVDRSSASVARERS